MSHITSGTILHSMLEPFNPDNEHYEGVRDHFTSAELAQIDAIRAYQDDHQFTLVEKVFISYMLDKVVFTAANP